MGRLVKWFYGQLANLLCFGSLLFIGIGFGMERLSLGFIVPGALVFTVMVLWRVLLLLGEKRK